jgi:hypothetical protein
VDLMLDRHSLHQSYDDGPTADEAESIYRPCMHELSDGRACVSERMICATYCHFKQEKFNTIPLANESLLEADHANSQNATTKKNIRYCLGHSST